MARRNEPSDTVLSLGGRLSAAREKRGLPVEKAAHDTRIRLQRLKELESDDYSHFPHPSYARMFLTDYAKYLGIPVADIRSQLPDGGDCGAGGYQYMQELNGESVPEQTVRRSGPRRRVMPVVLTFVAIVALLGLGFNLTMTLRKLDHLGIGQPTESAELVPAEATPVEPESDPVIDPVLAQDVALLKESLARPVSDVFLPVPATLAVPAPTPDDRAAFFVGSEFEPERALQ